MDVNIDPKTALTNTQTNEKRKTREKPGYRISIEGIDSVTIKNKAHLEVKETSDSKKCVAYCIDLMYNKQYPHVKLSGVSKLIDKCVFVAELVKRKVRNLHQVNVFETLEYKKVYTPLVQNPEYPYYEKVKVKTVLHITLSKQTPTNTKQAGYQRPLEIKFVSTRDPRDYLKHVIEETKQPKKKQLMIDARHNPDEYEIEFDDEVTPDYPKPSAQHGRSVQFTPKQFLQNDRRSRDKRHSEPFVQNSDSRFGQKFGNQSNQFAKNQSTNNSDFVKRNNNDQGRNNNDQGRNNNDQGRNNNDYERNNNDYGRNNNDYERNRQRSNRRNFEVLEKKEDENKPHSSRQGNFREKRHDLEYVQKVEGGHEIKKEEQSEKIAKKDQPKVKFIEEDFKKSDQLKKEKVKSEEDLDKTLFPVQVNNYNGQKGKSNKERIKRAKENEERMYQNSDYILKGLDVDNNEANDNNRKEKEFRPKGNFRPAAQKVRYNSRKLGYQKRGPYDNSEYIVKKDSNELKNDNNKEHINESEGNQNRVFYHKPKYQNYEKKSQNEYYQVKESEFVKKE